MDDLSLEALEALALAATPGPWTADGDYWDGRQIYAPGAKVIALGDDGACGDPECCGSPSYRIEMSDADAAFIAAANPDTIRALVLALREARDRSLSASLGAGLLMTLKAECEKQHARAEQAEAEVARLKERVLEYKEAEQHVLRQWREQEAEVARLRAENERLKEVRGDAWDALKATGGQP